MTSVAISGLPVRETTVKTSGKRFKTFSILKVDSTDEVMEILGRRQAWTVISPSSSEGINSPPKNGKSASETTKDNNAAIIIFLGFRNALSRVLSYHPFNL